MNFNDAGLLNGRFLRWLVHCRPAASNWKLNEKTQLILFAFDEYFEKVFIETGSLNGVCIQYTIMLEWNWIKFVICQAFCIVSNYMNAKHSERTSIIII